MEFIIAMELLEKVKLIEEQLYWIIRRDGQELSKHSSFRLCLLIYNGSSLAAVILFLMGYIWPYTHIRGVWLYSPVYMCEVCNCNIYKAVYVAASGGKHGRRCWKLHEVPAPLNSFPSHKRLYEGTSYRPNIVTKRLQTHLQWIFNMDHPYHSRNKNAINISTLPFLGFQIHLSCLRKDEKRCACVWVWWAMREISH